MEIKDLTKRKQTRSEKIWILFFRVPGVLLFFLPFIPITISYIDSTVEKLSLDAADWKLLGLGFFLVWGSEYFGVIANKIGTWFLKIAGVSQ